MAPVDCSGAMVFIAALQDIFKKWHSSVSGIRLTLNEDISFYIFFCAWSKTKFHNQQFRNGPPAEGTSLYRHVLLAAGVNHAICVHNYARRYTKNSHYFSASEPLIAGLPSDFREKGLAYLMLENSDFQMTSNSKDQRNGTVRQAQI